MQQYGRPVAYYSDKHSIFRQNHPDHEGELTQFGRILKTLDIAAIHANTPQAKGRVERANQTLQDRLVKELRLQGISDIETANTWLPAFIEDYNRRFAVSARSEQDAHRPILHDEQELNLIFTIHYQRKLSKNLTLQFKNRQYQLQGYGNGYRLRGAMVTLCESHDEQVTLLHKGKMLNYRILAQGEQPAPVVDEKSLSQAVAQAIKKQQSRPKHKPAPDHPWRRFVIQPSTPQNINQPL